MNGFADSKFGMANGQTSSGMNGYTSSGMNGRATNGMANGHTSSGMSRANGMANGMANGAASTSGADTGKPKNKFDAMMQEERSYEERSAYRPPPRAAAGPAAYAHEGYAQEGSRPAGGAYRPPGARGGDGRNFVQDFMADYEGRESGWGTAGPQLTGKEIGGDETDLTQARVSGDGELPLPIKNFNDSTFPSKIMATIHSQGFQAPTPIQAYCWPVLGAGRDVIGIAKTGSGKTLAFLLPPFASFVNQRTEGRVPLMLVMAPTRELACQIQAEAERFGRRLGIQSVCCYGGAPRGDQYRQIRRGLHLVVGTPGRLNDFLECGQLKLHACTYLVLDEADRMLDMGFEPQIRTIIDAMPYERQTMMFSATWPREVRRLASDYLSRPVHIQIGSHDATANKDITQEVVIVRGQREKLDTLFELLKGMPQYTRVLVFTNTKRMCESIADELRYARISCVTIHGDREQREREQALGAFKSGRATVMVATDVAARGLDIKGVGYVINFDVADQQEDHIHRIGRTGRAGEKGIAITFLDHRDAKQAREVMRTMEKVGQEIPYDLRELARAAGSGGGGNSRYGGGKGKGRSGGGYGKGGGFGRPKW